MEEKVTPNEELASEAAEQTNAEVSDELTFDAEECEKASRGDKKKLKKAEAGGEKNEQKKKKNPTEKRS